jgi:tryptophan synthase beta chain
MNPEVIFAQPDAAGFFGRFGGSFISETLAQAVEELHQAYLRYRDDPAFNTEFQEELADYVGRPSPVYYARRLSEETGGARLFLKREDLNHTGAHKINNVIGQAMLARRMGKRRIIAETGAGQHGVATATICARYGLECCDLHGQRGHSSGSAPTSSAWRLLGATVVPVIRRLVAR